MSYRMPSDSANIGRPAVVSNAGVVGGVYGALTSSFSVADILSPPEKYNLDAVIGNSGAGGASGGYPSLQYPAMQAPGMAGMGGMYPGYVPQLSPHHSASSFPGQYCATGPCTDYGPYATPDPVTVRTTTTCWYSPNHDSRFACECNCAYLLIVLLYGN